MAGRGGKKGKPKAASAVDPAAIVVLPPESAESEDGTELDPIEVLPAESGQSLPISEVDDSDDDDPRDSDQRIVPYDPLGVYLREVSRYKHLTREEEVDLAERYQSNKDLDAAYKLVTSNLWLVVKIARDYERAARSLLDVIQEGNMGLMEAVKNFDPYRGVRFPSYAVWWIKAYILRFVIANWRMVKIGTTQAQRKLFFNLKKEKDRLEAEGFYPAPKLLAEKLNVRESDVIEMEQRLESPDMSVHAPLGHEGDADYLSVLPSGELTAEDLLSEKEQQTLIQQSLREFASTLNEKERVIFHERLLGDEKVTLQEIAERFTLSKERIRQIENRIREKLKTFLQEKLGVGPDMPPVD